LSTSTKLNLPHPCNLRLQLLHRDPSSGLACWTNRSDLESQPSGINSWRKLGRTTATFLSSLEEDNIDGHQGQVPLLRVVTVKANNFGLCQKNESYANQLL
ncbi:hypothetical protein PanWU01x14_176740, partial [Parasponia andersonii]